MKKLRFVSILAAATLVTSQAFALSSFPEGTVGIGGFEPGTTRDTGTGEVTTTDTAPTIETTRGNGRGNGNGKGRNK
jgi:hypothetical protein